MYSIDVKRFDSNSEYIMFISILEKVAKFRLKVTKQLNKCDIRCKGKIVLKQMKRLKLRQVEYKLVC